MIADICVIAIVAFFIYIGSKMGLMRSLVKIISYVVSIGISFFMYPLISEFLIKTPFYEKLAELISKKYIFQGTSEVQAGTMGIISRYINEGAKSVADGIAGSVAVLMINIIAFVAVLILSKLIIRLVGRACNIFTKLPVIKQFNRLGGAILGGVSGILAAYIMCAVLLVFTPVDSRGRIETEIEKSAFASKMCQNNVILNFVGEEEKK